ncbi:MAG: glycosyltransferase family 2 protein [Hyphomicrobiales bacterium]|nr:glycosyltransferase family 2 protein [Hyphomicrobiales bacterium]
MHDPLPRIAIVTPSYNHRQYLQATIDSVLDQNYPALAYHVQDGGSQDGTTDLLARYGDRLSWRSARDSGQGNAINTGFALLGADCDVMAYLNSDDTLMPDTLAYVAHVFQTRPEIDIVYGHRIIIDGKGLETARAVLPSHDAKALTFLGYIPQETLFWRRRVWDKIGPIDESFRFAMDWDFMLRAQNAGFRYLRLPRFLGCFRVHAEQKTSAMMNVGFAEMQRIRKRQHGRELTRTEINLPVLPFVTRQFVYHWLYRLNILRY